MSSKIWVPLPQWKDVFGKELPNQVLQFPVPFVSRSALMTGSHHWEVSRSLYNSAWSGHYFTSNSWFSMMEPRKWAQSQDGRSQNPWTTYRWKLSVEQEHLLRTVMGEINYCVWAIVEFGSLVMAANVTLTMICDKEALIFSPSNGRKKPLTMKLNSFIWNKSLSSPTASLI